MKPLLSLLVLLFISSAVYLLQKKSTLNYPQEKQISLSASKPPNPYLAIKQKAVACKKYIVQKGFSAQYVFLIDMRLPSGKARFFIYDLLKDSIVKAGLVAHGSCRTKFLAAPQFSNVPDCGCTSIGRYKIGGVYDGRFGKAYKLLGLDSTNSNAYKRDVVLHAYDCVPDTETYPNPICNSLGCAMVSYQFLKVAGNIIEQSKKPVLLWMYY